MSNVIEFSKEKSVEDQIVESNHAYFSRMFDKIQQEFNAIERTGDQQMISSGEIIRDIVSKIVVTVQDIFAGNPNLNKRVNAEMFLSQCMQSVNAILAGGVISPITGDEEEWEDVTVPEDKGQALKIHYNNEDFEIKIESVQLNRRYPKIYRLNNDNSLAHRLDYVQFHDMTHPENIHLTEDSIRFIQFPYKMDTLHINCSIKDGVITGYDWDYDDIVNGLVYPNPLSTDASSYILAPKIPFSYISQEAIDTAIENYLLEVDSDTKLL